MCVWGLTYVRLFFASHSYIGRTYTQGQYENLPWAILARTLLRLMPILFIPFLVPTGSSSDKTRYDISELSSLQKTKAADAEGDELSSTIEMAPATSAV